MMPHRRFRTCVLAVAVAMSTMAPALARGPWSALVTAVASNRNVVYSPVLEREIYSRISSTSMAVDVSANCDEAGLPADRRVFVADLYVPAVASHNGDGNSCVVHAGSRSKIEGLATFNSAWWPLAIAGKTMPAPFYSERVTYSVPTMHLRGLARVERPNNTMVVEINFQDARYGLLLFPRNPTVAEVRAATGAVLAEPHPGNLYTARPLSLLQLALPSFTLTTRYQISARATKAFQSVGAVTFLKVGESGAGKPSDWPPLPRLGFGHLHLVPASIAFNRPVCFAIVRFDTRSVLILGYVAHPSLNA